MRSRLLPILAVFALYPACGPAEPCEGLQTCEDANPAEAAPVVVRPSSPSPRANLDPRTAFQVMRCENGGCAQLCRDGDDCRGTCPGGGCTQTCRGGSLCTFSCTGGGCVQDCDPGASCTLSCAGEACTDGS